MEDNVLHRFGQWREVLGEPTADIFHRRQCRQIGLLFGDGIC
jgi:hypothetical protein